MPDEIESLDRIVSANDDPNTYDEMLKRKSTFKNRLLCRLFGHKMVLGELLVIKDGSHILGVSVCERCGCKDLVYQNDRHLRAEVLKNDK